MISAERLATRIDTRTAAQLRSSRDQFAAFMAGVDTQSVRDTLATYDARIAAAEFLEARSASIATAKAQQEAA